MKKRSEKNSATFRRCTRWAKASKLGDHDNREEGGANEEELVLVIRGELLKRYPTAVIYAHRACWQRKDTDACGRR